MKKTIVFTIILLLLLPTWNRAKGDEFQGEIEIVFPGGNYVSFFDEQIRPAFEEQYPSIKVISAAEGGTGTSGTDKVQARVAAGDVPDIYVGPFGALPASFAEQGILAELEDMPGVPDLLERIDPLFVKKIYGHIYYIPWNATTTLMIYNKALFEEAGLNPENPPKTLDEFLVYAEKIYNLPNREDGEKTYGTVFWNDALNWGGWYWAMLAPIYYNLNGGEYKLLNDFGTDIVFDKPEAKMIEFLEFLQKAQKYALPSMAEKNFFNRHVGMWLQFGFGWKANLSQAKDTPMKIGEDVAVAPVPTLNEGDVPWSTLDGRSLMVFKSNPDQEKLALELVRFLMRDEYNLLACKELGQLPTLKSLAADPYFQLPENKPFVEQLQHTIEMEPLAVLDEIANEILKAISLVVIAEELTPEEAVKQAAANAREILKASVQ